MHCIFAFYLFLSSSVALSKVVLKGLFDNIWKPFSPFSKFCVNCLLRLSFVSYNNCVLNDVNGACWCVCSLVALRVPEMCLLPGKTRKNLSFLSCTQDFDQMRKCYSDINESTWLQLLLYFIVMIHIAALILGMSFLFWISGFKLKFSRVAMSRKRLKFESKTELTAIGLFLEIFVGVCLVSSISYLHGLKFALNCSIFIPLWRYQTFSIVWGVLWSFL